MFRATAVRLSALSKRTRRVRVQLLKDFPMFNLYMGQVTKVKPSFMRNYLHNFNGARYVMSESDIDLELLSRSQARDTLAKEKSNVETKTVDRVEASGKVSPKKTSGNADDKTTRESKQKREKPKGILEKNITIEDVKIPGLEL
ncbi:hypothetical protein HG536_0A08930 [Torulaspora globosa]|uniref:Ribosomal protein L9 domain-containing protein n=1 Tax=Torulaspora globosa TaxID=48254 RepID=A0A7G3ZC40_9SACH|nr:uncharacterized protein HG536_0A08930 [Torulaspora globosa]QLL31076.1 hypothetical protein HG536_0A08930 [Torulaspora globosa]